MRSYCLGTGLGICREGTSAGVSQGPAGANHAVNSVTISRLELNPCSSFRPLDGVGTIHSGTTSFQRHSTDRGAQLLTDETLAHWAEVGTSKEPHTHFHSLDYSSFYLILTIVWVTNFIFILVCRLLNLQNHNTHKYPHLLLIQWMNGILLSLTVMGELTEFSLRKKKKLN